MIFINYPEPDFNIKYDEGKPYIFDTIRKIWLVLTEEEWVRQNFIRYLVSEMRYPSTVIAVEKEILLNGLKKRFDVLIYDKSLKPWMLVECKAPSVPLNDDVKQQVLRYHISVPVPYLVITNGHSTSGWQKSAGRLQEMQQLPKWEERL